MECRIFFAGLAMILPFATSCAPNVTKRRALDEFAKYYIHQDSLNFKIAQNEHYATSAEVIHQIAPEVAIYNLDTLQATPVLPRHANTWVLKDDSLYANPDLTDRNLSDSIDKYFKRQTPHTIIVDLRANNGGLLVNIASLGGQFHPSGTPILNVIAPNGLSSTFYGEWKNGANQQIQLCADSTTKYGATILSRIILAHRNATWIGSSFQPDSAIYTKIRLEKNRIANVPSGYLSIPQYLTRRDAQPISTSGCDTN